MNLISIAIHDAERRASISGVKPENLVFYMGKRVEDYIWRNLCLSLLPCSYHYKLMGRDFYTRPSLHPDIIEVYEEKVVRRPYDLKHRKTLVHRQRLDAL